jgi:hypothetical protein
MSVNFALRNWTFVNPDFCKKLAHALMRVMGNTVSMATSKSTTAAIAWQVLSVKNKKRYAVATRFFTIDSPPKSFNESKY